MRNQPSSTLLGTARLAGASLALIMIAAVCSDRTADASQLRYTPMVRAVAGARPAVVNLHGRKTVRTQNDGYGTSDSLRQVNGMGTGIIIDESGYVITNYHVIEGVSKIRVTLDDKRTTTGRLIAYDPATDLAIIKISVDGKLPVIKVGTSSDLMPAEPVVAVGNAYGYEHTATQGIISELHRTVQVSEEQTYYNLIQTDASINPGNSGGPLLNIDGEMIGLNVAVRVGAQGIGFAIPVDDVMEVAARLMASEVNSSISHGVVGKTAFQDNVPQFVVHSIQPDTPAGKSGLKSGDVITGVGDKKIDRTLDFERAMMGARPGDEVTVTVRRTGEPVAVNLVLASAQRTTNSDDDRFWNVLGLRLESIDADSFSRLNSRYRGGLKVSAVRPGSPAERQGISRGDVLVGMHLWETISQENVTYILNRPDFEKFQPVRFYILRSGETLYGHMHVSVSH